MLLLILTLCLTILSCFIYFACTTSDDSNNDNETPSSDSNDPDDDEVKHSAGYIILDDLPEDVWTDPDSGLMWQVWPKYRARLLYYEAIDHCKTLVYGGYEDWHLPSISELRSLIRGCPGTQTGGGCDLTDSCLDFSDECWNDQCYGCESWEGPADGGFYWPDHFAISEKYFYNSYYWSSSECPYDYYLQDNAWAIYFIDGSFFPFAKYSARTARCVR